MSARDLWFPSSLFQVLDPPADALPGLFDPANMAELKGSGDVKTILMVLQAQADIIKDSESMLIEEENLLGIEQPEMSQRAFDQTLAIQKGQVTTY